MSCFFEYDYRWSQFTEDLLSGEEAQVRQAIMLLEERDRRLEDHLQNRPCGGGASIYCATESKALDSGTEDPQLTASVTFTLSSSATVNVQIVYSFSSAPGDASVPSSAFEWAIDASVVSTPPLRVWMPTVTTATTLASGEHTISTALTTGLLNTVQGSVMLVVIVGSDTEDDCVTFV